MLRHCNEKLENVYGSKGGTLWVKAKSSLSMPRSHIEGAEVQLHSLLTFALDGGEKLPSPVTFTIWKEAGTRRV
jgi:hypothetical protein